MARRAVFLDRDGVLNESILRNGVAGPPWSLDQLRITPGARECLEDLRRAGFVLIVVTNQPDVARGDLDRGTLDAINARLTEALPVDALLACVHDGAWCCCRKPSPGMLYAGAFQFEVDLAQSFMVGDRAKDVDAGHNAGCRSVWIRTPDQPERARPVRPADAEVASLRAAVDWILSRAG